MRSLTTTELSRMQGAQEDGMMDSAVILSYQAGAVDEYGMPTQSYLEGPVTECGLDMNPTQEWNAPAGGGSETQIELGEARLRLPIDSEISNQDRIKITHRFGVMLDEDEILTYELIEAPRRGPSGLVARLRKVSHA